MSTYVPIQAITLSSASASITFTGIPQTYNDLIIVGNTASSGDDQIPTVRVGNASIDSGSNYSNTVTGFIAGAGAISFRDSNATYMRFARIGTSNSQPLGSFILHFQNYFSNTINKTVLARTGNIDRSSAMSTGLWRSTSSINSIQIFEPSGGLLAPNSTFTLYGMGTGSPKAFGGTTVRSDGTYWYHAFTSSGVFEPVENLSNVDYLVVAGGGGTITVANQYYAGGGGGGGLRSTISPTGGGGSPESKLSLTANTPYTVTVGAGAPATASGRFGVQGSNSVFGSIISIGGGYGSTGPGATSGAGGNGGSGGGAGSNNGSPFITYSGGTGTAGQGYNGGQNETSDAYAAGAGGGAAGAGGNAGAGGAGKGGTGGAAALNSISGTATYYAGGGWGGRGFYGAATKGDDGTGYNQNLNTGMGGNATTASGQSGIVIVRYPV
jgi:hypothetical protein